jgi:hypothetical protein
MIKINKFTPVITIPVRLISKFYTAFAQNILSKYGIGRWNRQGSKLIFRKNSDKQIPTDELKAPDSYTEIKRYNSFLQIFKYFSNPINQRLKPVQTQIIDYRPFPYYITRDKQENNIIHTEDSRQFDREVIKLKHAESSISKYLQNYIKITDTAKACKIVNPFNYTSEKPTGADIKRSTADTHKTAIDTKKAGIDDYKTSVHTHRNGIYADKTRINSYKTVINDFRAETSTGRTATGMDVHRVLADKYKTGTDIRKNEIKSNNVYDYNKYIELILNSESTKRSIPEETQEPEIHMNRDAQEKTHESAEKILRAKVVEKHLRLLEEQVRYKDIKEQNKSSAVRNISNSFKLTNKRSVEYKKEGVFLNTISEIRALVNNPSVLIKSNPVQEEQYRKQIENKLMGRKNYSENTIHSKTEPWLIRKANERNMTKALNPGEQDDLAHILPKFTNAPKERNLVFYKPQVKEMKIPTNTGDKPKDVIIGENSVYAKAFTPAKQEKKKNLIETEEVNVLAERVFQILEKKLAIQKDRRGLK